MPLVFLLLPDKKEDTYINAFAELVAEAGKLNITLCPRTVICDFEKALQDAIVTLWPAMNIVGCRFHLTQAWWRKMQELGLTATYKAGMETGKWLQWLFGLTLLTPEEAVECFYDECLACMPTNDDRIVKLIDYIHDNYMKDGATFPSYLWAAMEVEDRTSNACKAFHSHLSTYFHSPHPDITLFIIGLKALQRNTEMCKNTADTNAHVTDYRIRRRQATINTNIQKSK